MDHISFENLDIYVLNRDLLKANIGEIEAHLSKCSECRANLNELIEFYEGVKEFKHVNTAFGEIEGILQERKKQNITSVKSIFETNYLIRKTVFYKAKTFIKEIVEPVGDFLSSIWRPPYKLAFSAAAILLIVVITYQIYNFFTDKDYKTKQIYVSEDSIKGQKETEKSLETKNDSLITEFLKYEDSLINIEEHDKTKNSRSRVKTRKPIFGSIAAIFVTGLKGFSKQYDFVKAVHLKYGSAVLFVYEKGTTDTAVSLKGIERIVASDSELFRILFPKTGLYTNENSICLIRQGKTEGFDIYISEKNEAIDCENSESVIYSFDTRLRINNVKFSDRFITSYRDKFALNENVLSLKLQLLSDSLRCSLKYWDGTTFSYDYTQNSTRE